jgi:hypothetical protein
MNGSTSNPQSAVLPIPYISVSMALSQIELRFLFKIVSIMKTKAKVNDIPCTATSATEAVSAAS